MQSESRRARVSATLHCRVLQYPNSHFNLSVAALVAAGPGQPTIGAPDVQLQAMQAQVIGHTPRSWWRLRTQIATKHPGPMALDYVLRLGESHTLVTQRRSVTNAATMLLKSRSKEQPFCSRPSDYY